MSRSDALAVRLSMLTAAIAIGHQVAAKSLREGLFLSTFTVADLPRAMLGSALAAMPVAIAVARLMSRVGPTRVVPAAFVTSAALSFLEWWLLPRLPRPIVALVYFHVSIGGALLMSAFWSLVNERFDPHSLKHLVGRIGASATLGGLLGGALMERAAQWLDARSGLLLVGALGGLAAASSHTLSASTTSTRTSDDRSAPVAFNGYLVTLALLVACSAAASAFSDFALKHAAADRFASAEQLVRFFALFYTGAALASFLLQALVARRLLESVGLGGTLAVPPAAAVITGVASLIWPSFLTVAMLRGSDLALGPSLFRTAFEPLFTPLPARTKRATKALIDVVFDKGGDAVASLVVLAIALGSPTLVRLAPPALATVCGALLLFLALGARRGYVRELEASLRAGTLPPEAAEMSDATTRLTLSATAFGIDRDMLLARIAEMRAQEGTAAAGVTVSGPSPADDQLLRDVRSLLLGDLATVRAVLSRHDLDRRLAAFVVPQLGRNELAKLAVTALRAMGDGVVGTLSDALLDPAQPVAVRRRIPHVLRVARNLEAARALARALSAEELEVRYRAALALGELVRHAPECQPDSKELHALALAEVARTPLSAAAFDHVFALLSLCTTRGALELARQGLRSDDPKLRGTALEYLESLLPEAVRAEIVSAFAHSPIPRSETRTQLELADELRRSFRGELALPSLPAEPD